MTTLKNIGSFKHMRLRMLGLAGLVLPLVLTTGFFTAGTSAGAACNTFPFVGSHYFYTRNHFISDIPLWKNFTENKLVTQVNHRTLASIMTLLYTYQCYRFYRLPGLTRAAKLAPGLLLAVLWSQVGLGVSTIW